jgi:ParB/RepB/Spo0J family partition protein
LNVRKNLDDSDSDGGIADLANAIERQSLLSPITVYKTPEGRYAVIAGQRRLLAVRQLQWASIPAIVRESMNDGEATAVSLIENVHRADMNPQDKAVAFRALLNNYGSIHQVSKETGVGVTTIKKYLSLTKLSPELQMKIASGEAKATAALSVLAEVESNHNRQVEIFDRIHGFRQDVQKEILQRYDARSDNLDLLIDQALEGEFDVLRVKKCPWDCPSIPSAMKRQIAALIKAGQAGSGLN